VVYSQSFEDAGLLVLMRKKMSIDRNYEFQATGGISFVVYRAGHQSVTRALCRLIAGRYHATLRQNDEFLLA